MLALSKTLFLMAHLTDRVFADYLIALLHPVLHGACSKPMEGLQRGRIWQAACIQALVVSWVQHSFRWLSLPALLLLLLLLPGQAPEWAETPVTQL